MQTATRKVGIKKHQNTQMHCVNPWLVPSTAQLEKQVAGNLQPKSRRKAFMI